MGYFIINFLISLLVIIGLHESIHFVVAKILRLSPIFAMSKFATPIVKFKNGHQYLRILMTSLSAPLLTVIIIYFIPMNKIFMMCKILGMINIINILPFTADGETALYAILEIWKKRRKK